MIIWIRWDFVSVPGLIKRRKGNGLSARQAGEAFGRMKPIRKSSASDGFFPVMPFTAWPESAHKSQRGPPGDFRRFVLLLRRKYSHKFPRVEVRHKNLARLVPLTFMIPSESLHSMRL